MGVGLNKKVLEKKLLAYNLKESMKIYEKYDNSKNITREIMKLDMLTIIAYMSLLVNIEDI